MSWLFSQALVEAFSGASSSDGEPCAPLSVMPTPHKFWRNDKTMECSNLSRFGLTCAVLTEDRGAELLTLFLEASRARTSVQPDEVQASRGNGPASGLSLPGSLARFDRDSCSWRTPQCSLLADLDEFSETWPRWGSMRNGASWARTTPALPTVENGSGFLLPTPTAQNYGTNQGGSAGRVGPVRESLQTMATRNTWPTPLATDGKNGGPNSRGSKGDLRLSAAVHVFPTPCARDYFPPHKPEYIQAKKAQGHGMSNLVDHVAQFPTPCARGYRSPNLKPFSERGGGRKGEQLVNFIAHFPTPRAGSKNGGGAGLDGGSGARKTMVERFGEEEAKALGSGGQLNPPWVELLMGWPKEWTSMNPMSELEFQLWGDGFAANPGNAEKLPALREATGTEEVRGQAGRPDHLHQAEVLLSGLCQQQEAPETLGDISLAGEEVPQGSMRSLRIQKGAPGSPCGSEPGEQRPGKSPDPVQALPRFLAHYGPQSWQDGSWENAVPRVAQKVAHRVDRLKAIGNGQVPAVAALAFRTLMRRLNEAT